MRIILLFLLPIVALPPIHAQQAITSATLGGRVEDSSGAAIPHLEVTIRNLERGESQTARTGAQGRYQFLRLPAGRYELSIQAADFAPIARRMELGVGQAADVPITLVLGEFNQKIDVTDAAVSIEAVRTQVSQTVLPEQIDSLPLNGRNYMDLALLVPGVSRTNTGAPQQFAETSAVAGTGISVASQRNLYNNFVVDGLSANDDAADLAGTFFSEEVIREFQVVTAGSNAEFGRSLAGVINIATRSGSNEWHGRLYDYFRNQRLDARNALAAQKGPLTQSQYGATLGGPVVRNRTFVFTNFEQTRRHASGLVTIAPANVTAINQVIGADGYPGPPVQTGQYATGYDTTEVFGRLDHQFSSSNQLMLRYNLYDIASPNARNVGSINDISRGTVVRDRDQTIALNQVATFSPRLLNEARFEYTRSRLSAPGNSVSGPAVNISGVASFGPSTTSPIARDNNLYQISDTVSVQRGSHFVKAGLDFEWNRLNIVFPGNALAATYAFSSIAAFRAGQYSTFTQAFGVPSQFQSNPNFGAFAQDEWKVTTNFTVHAGARYDVQSLPRPVQTYFGAIAPRIGFAWSPADRKMVIRAGYGMFYDRIPLRTTSNALQRDGSKYRTAVLSFGQAGAPAFPSQLAAFPAAQLISITVIDPHIQPSNSHQASFQIERELAKSTTLSVGYQWTRGMHLILSRNLNVPTLSAAQAALLGVPNLGRPNPDYGNIGQYNSGGDSYYNGLLVSLKSRLWSHTNLQISYNFSRAIDDVGNNFFSAPQNNFNLRDDRGLSDSDQRHRLTVAAVLNSPVAGRASLARALFGGWQLSPLLIYTSRLPFNVQLNFDRNFDTNLNDRPVGVGRNTGVGFNFLSLDVRLSRSFRLTERWRLQALAESFNTLNRANWALPNNIIGSGVGPPLPSFGRATAAYDPRQLQIGVRVNF